MADTWDSVAHAVIKESDSELIKANPTNLAKYGAPSVAIVTAVLAAVLGSNWKGGLDPAQPGVVLAAAIIVAAAVLGVCFVFLTDIRTRGAMTVARYEALAALARNETARLAESKRADAATAAEHAAEDKLHEAEHEFAEMKKTIRTVAIETPDEHTKERLQLALNGSA